MTHRAFGLLIGLALGLLVAPLAAHAQPSSTVSRIGFVTGGGDPGGWSLEIDSMPEGFPKAVRHGLRELGYAERPRHRRLPGVTVRSVSKGQERCDI